MSSFIRTWDDELKNLAVSLIRYQVFQNALALASYSFMGSFAGTGHVKLNYLMSFLRDGLLPCVSIFVLGLSFGMPGVKVSLLAAVFLILFICFCIPAVMNFVMIS